VVARPIALAFHEPRRQFFNALCQNPALIVLALQHNVSRPKWRKARVGNV